MSARKKAKSTPKSQVPEAEKPPEEGNLAPEAGIKKPVEEINEASTPVVKMPSEEGTEAPSPEIDPPVGDTSSNNVDTPTPGTEIVLTTNNPEVLDASLEEPGYPAYEWHDLPEFPLIVPNDAMTDEHLVAFVHQKQGAINNRLRRTIQDYWLIGKAHHFLFLRHGDDKIGPDGKKIKSRWREDWLPRLGYNHTTDQQLRVLATELTFEEVGQYPNKTRALQDLGFSVGGVKKAIEHEKKERAQEGNVLGMAEPLDEDDIEAAPQGVANHRPVAQTKPEPKVQAKATPEYKIAAKAVPQAEPLEDDPMVGTESLVVTLEGAEVSEIEPVVAEAGFTLVAKTQDMIVGMMWYGQEPLKNAKERVNHALGRVRDEKKNLHVEARYLCLSEVVPV